MRRVPLAFALLAAAAATPAPAIDWLWFGRGHRDLEVITVTDVSPEGRARPAPAPGQPQYYVAGSLGFRDLGGIMGGIKEPPPKEVVRLVSGELAKQGYLPAKPGGPMASLVLVYTWGTLNAESFFGPNPDYHPQINRGQILKFLGGEKLGFNESFFNPLTRPVTGLQFYEYQARAIYDLAAEDFYIVAVAAYDVDAVVRKERRKPLWITRIASPSRGFELADSLPAMLAIAGPQFGRETPKPVWINASDKFKPNVHLGELQLVEYLGDAPLPVAEMPKGKKH